MYAQVFQAAETSRFVDAIAQLVDHRFVPEAETIIALLTVALLAEVEAGDVAPAAANQLYVRLDARLSSHVSAESPFSEEAQELIFQGEMLHHLGDEYGPVAADLQQLAETILRRAAPAP